MVVVHYLTLVGLTTTFILKDCRQVHTDGFSELNLRASFPTQFIIMAASSLYTKWYCDQKVIKNKRNKNAANRLNMFYFLLYISAKCTSLYFNLYYPYPRMFHILHALFLWAGLPFNFTLYVIKTDTFSCNYSNNSFRMGSTGFSN